MGFCAGTCDFTVGHYIHLRLTSSGILVSPGVLAGYGCIQ